MLIQTEIQGKATAIKAKSAAIIAKSAVIRGKGDELRHKSTMHYEIVRAKLKSRADRISQIVNNT